MPKDWWKQREDKREDLEEARINETGGRLVEAPAGRKVVPSRDRRTASVDSGTNGTVKHEGF